MRPPLKIELWDARGNAQVLNVAMSFKAAERIYQQHVAQLRAGEVIRCRDAAGALIFTSDPTDWPPRGPR
jgi:hypothetical protein